MRVCKVCNRGEPEVRLQKRTPLCDVHHSEYNRQHYLANKDKYLEKARRNKQRQIKDYKSRIAQIKSSGCVDCGRTGPEYCFDFDHINGDKVDNISVMVLKARPWALIETEIAKCEVVCAWCHRVRTHNRRQP